jgi:LAO/AO transport system kinase
MSKNRPSKSEFVNGIHAGNRLILSKAITLIESDLNEDKAFAQEILEEISLNKTNSVRIGITGAPGAGKSTLIEALGVYLTQLNKKVAVIAIDPTSSFSKGSILGDKTRMEQLANSELAFIRPSPSKEYLGGTNEVSKETILLCEAAGYEVIIVETVGVGQSEIMVSNLVDYFLLLHLAGSGDELQGIKKGILEHADKILVTKADGNNIPLAEAAKIALENGLHYSDKNKISVETISSHDIDSIANLWKNIESDITKLKKSGSFTQTRGQQDIKWINELLKRKLIVDFFNNDETISNINKANKEIGEGKISIYNAVNQILNKRKNL